jgi:predicted small lipoprotein YifL
MRLILRVFFVLALAAGLAACGKKGPPDAPGKSEYPRTYPAPR